MEKTLIDKIPKNIIKFEIIKRIEKGKYLIQKLHDTANLIIQEKALERIQTNIKFIEEQLETKFKENEISRLTIQTLVSDSLMRQILRQLNKLIDVIAVSNEETTYLKGVLLDENLL